METETDPAGQLAQALDALPRRFRSALFDARASQARMSGPSVDSSGSDADQLFWSQE